MPRCASPGGPLGRRGDGGAARPAGPIHPGTVEHPGGVHRSERFPITRDAGSDTTTSPGRLMLTVLGGLAEFARDLITPAPVKDASVLRLAASSSAANPN
jgi:hypothetical protein